MEQIATEPKFAKALTHLATCAHSEDITRTAADLKISVESVRRYLRRDRTATDEDTARLIHDHLRNLTLTRTHSIISMLETAA